MAAWQWLQRRPVLYLWVPVLAWMGLIFYLSAQPDLPQPGLGWWDEVVSSGAHAFMYGVLAILWMRVLNGQRYAAWTTLALTMAYALSDELHQFFVPGRFADPWDLACDGLGAVLALILWLLWHRR